MSDVPKSATDAKRVFISKKVRKTSVMLTVPT
jgi:hypothetical protein